MLGLFRQLEVGDGFTLGKDVEGQHPAEQQGDAQDGGAVHQRHGPAQGEGAALPQGPQHQNGKRCQQRRDKQQTAVQPHGAQYASPAMKGKLRSCYKPLQSLIQTTSGYLMRARKAGSSRIATLSRCAFSSIEPGSSPTTSESVLFETSYTGT